MAGMAASTVFLRGSSPSINTEAQSSTLPRPLAHLTQRPAPGASGLPARGPVKESARNERTNQSHRSVLNAGQVPDAMELRPAVRVCQVDAERQRERIKRHAPDRGYKKPSGSIVPAGGEQERAKR